MDALIRAGPGGLAQIDPNGMLMGLDGEFARLFGIRIDDALHRPVSELPSTVQDSWRQVVQSTQEGAPVCRWSIVIGDPPDRRAVDVVGWASTPANEAPVVHLLASESPPEHQTRSLSNVAERARLAREIHDGLAQELWLAKMTASKLARHPGLDSAGRALCEELMRSIDSGLAEARTAVLSMRAPAEAIVTLSELVEQQVEEFSDRFGIRVDSHLQQGHTVPPRVSVEVLRILQEALNNIRKHATARRITVRLQHRPASVILAVRDDGKGFDPALVRSGFGRQSMHERARSIGASLKITSVPGRGTVVTLRVPAHQLVGRR